MMILPLGNDSLIEKGVLISAGRSAAAQLARTNPSTGKRMLSVKKLKHEGTLKDRRQFIESNEAEQLIHRQITNRKISGIYSDIDDLEIGTSQRELDWIAQILRYHSEKLKRFVGWRSEFDFLFAAGKYHEAKKLVPIGIREFGWSLSILERKLAVFNATEDYSGANATVQAIIESKQDIVKFIACAYHFNHHPLMRAEYFAKLLENNIQQIQADKGTAAFVRLMIQKGYIGGMSDEHTLALLIYSIGKLPIYDQYEMLLHILQHLEELSKYHPATFFALLSLQKTILDPRLLYILSADRESTCPADILSGRIAGKSADQLMEILSAEISARLQRVVDPNDVVIGLQEAERWLDKQFKHPAIIASKVFIGALQGSVPAKGVAQLTTRGHHLRTVPSPELLSAAEYVKIAATTFCGGDLLGLYTSLNEHLKSYGTRAIEEHVSLTLELARTMPVMLIQLKEMPLFRSVLSAAPATGNGGVAVILAYACIDSSPMELSIRIEELLESLGLTTPSELIKSLPKQDEVEDFAMACCSLEVLEQLPSVGPTEQEVIEERLTILRHLSSYHNTDTKIINNEISELVKQQKLNSLFKIEEESRLRVNTVALAVKMKRLYKENDNDHLSGASLDGLHLGVLGCFLLDEEHGLDAELSNRIRHGKLRERLFSPFLGNKLIGPVGDLNAPTTNTGIPAPTPAPDELQLALALLSSKIEQQINTFVNDHAHLKLQDLSWQGFPGLLTSKATPDGLLCVNILKARSLQILKLALKEISVPTDIDQIIETSIESIWSALDEQLKLIRNHITGKIQQDLLKALFECEAALQTAGVQYNSDQFARCRSDISSVCREVAKWFSVPAKIEFPESPLGDVIELATKAVEHCSTNKLSLEADETARSKILPPAAVGDMYDILFLIFSNCLIHGKPTNEGGYSVWVNLDQNEMRVENECVNLDARVLEAKRLLEENSRDGVNHAVNIEGKSGLAKIVRLLRKLTKNRSPSLDVFSNNNRFCIKFGLSAIS